MRNLLIASIMISLFSCSEDENILSNKAELNGFTVEPASGFTPFKTSIDSINGEVQIFTSGDLSKLTFPLTLKTDIDVSEGATVVPASGTPVTFKDAEDFVSYTITSSDGTKLVKYIFTIRDRQITNGGFKSWFQETGMNSKPFQQVGKYKESTIWATANMGTSIYSVYTTTPVTEGSNTLVKIETVETVGIPIIAGALYLGKFDINSAMSDPTNPVAAAKLGIPFYERPKSVKLKYKFKAGAQMIQATPKQPGNLFGGFTVSNVAGKDKFGIEIALEKRNGKNVTVIAKTKFQSDQNVDNLTELTLPVNYLSNDTPTHFYISFSPSFDGGTFKGAIGSTLTIDDIELVY